MERKRGMKMKGGGGGWQTAAADHKGQAGANCYAASPQGEQRPLGGAGGPWGVQLGPTHVAAPQGRSWGWGRGEGEGSG